MPSETDGIAQVRRKDGTHVGMAIVTDENHIMTCAHVINQARGKSDFALEPPASDETFDIQFRFPVSGAGAYVCKWGPSDHSKLDLATLELTEPKPTAVACATFCVEPATSMEWKVFGQHQGEERPRWTTEQGSSVSSPIDESQIQLHGVGVAGRWIDSGDSGAAVWCAGIGGVIGIVTTKHRESAENRISCMISAQAMRSFWPINVRSSFERRFSVGLPAGNTNGAHQPKKIWVPDSNLELATSDAAAKFEIYQDYVTLIDRLTQDPQKKGIQVTDTTGLANDFSNWNNDTAYKTIMYKFSAYAKAYRTKFGPSVGVIRTFFVDPVRLDQFGRENLARILQQHIQLGVGARVVPIALSTPTDVVGDMGLYHGEIADAFFDLNRVSLDDPGPSSTVLRQIDNRRAFGSIEERINWLEYTRNGGIIVASEGELRECIKELAKLSGEMR